MTELIFLRWISLFTSSSLSCAPSPERIIERLKAEGQMIFAEERLYPRHQPAVLFTHKRDVLAPSTIFSTSLMGRKTPEMRLSPNRKWSPDDSMWRKIAHQISSLHSDKYWWMDIGYDDFSNTMYYKSWFCQSANIFWQFPKMDTSMDDP